MGNRVPVDGDVKRVLVVDDEASMSALVSSALQELGFASVVANNAPDALELANAEWFDLVTTDLRMPGMDGLELCGRLHADDPNLPVIMLSGHGDFVSAVGAMRAGAFDFLQKPFGVDDLGTAVNRAIERMRRLRAGTRGRRSSADADRFGELLGTSVPMQAVRALLSRVAKSDSSVLITGESGTGKELAAVAVHRESARRHGPYIAINCAALPPSLLEAELFGHERGAYTDARTTRPGLFVDAHGGTLFLDEIAELPPALQSKLLRALQERVVRPLGGRKELPFDVRLVTATNDDLEAAVAERRFRKDLFFRINVIEVVLPPLREREQDVELLARHFLEKFASQMRKNVTGLTDAAQAKLDQYTWPGNVRELQNTIERAVALAHHDRLTVEDLPPRLAQRKTTRPVAASVPMVTLDEVERRHILAVLQQCAGSRTAAAKILGLDRSTLWRKLERFGGEGG